MTRTIGRTGLETMRRVAAATVMTVGLAGAAWAADPVKDAAPAATPVATAAAVLATPDAAATKDDGQDAAIPAVTQPPAEAAEPADPNPGALTLSGGFDVLNQYMFRGIRQHSTGVAFWPWADLGITLHSGEGGLTSVGVNIGTWNSLHTGDTGTDGPSTKLWYESDFYTTLALGFSHGIAVGATYTAYTSPNNSFSTVKELSVKLSFDDSAQLGKASLKPYVLLAQEFDTAPGLGQADGGGEAGTYLEIAVAPGYSGSKASLAVPIKFGFSLSDYYELDGDDNAFGFASLGAQLTVPLGGTSRFGAWNVHGGVEFQKLGDTTTFFNGGDDTQFIGSIGIGFSY
jgi:hypothetical protein